MMDFIKQMQDPEFAKKMADAPAALESRLLGIETKMNRLIGMELTTHAMLDSIAAFLQNGGSVPPDFSKIPPYYGEGAIPGMDFPLGDEGGEGGVGEPG